MADCNICTPARGLMRSLHLSAAADFAPSKYSALIELACSAWKRSRLSCSNYDSPSYSFARARQEESDPWRSVTLTEARRLDGVERAAAAVCVPYQFLRTIVRGMLCRVLRRILGFFRGASQSFRVPKIDLQLLGFTQL